MCLDFPKLCNRISCLCYLRQLAIPAPSELALQTVSAQLPKSKQNTNSVLISKRVGNGSPLPASIDFVNIYRSVGG